MIPILIVAGVVLGHWWRFVLVAATIAWPLALVATDVLAFGWGLLSAAALALLNTLVGVLVHQVIARGIRRLWRTTRHRGPPTAGDPNAPHTGSGAL